VTDGKYKVEFANAVYGRKQSGLPCMAGRIKPGSVVSWGVYHYGEIGCQN
jgi:hypothetical protein